MRKILLTLIALLSVSFAYAQGSLYNFNYSAREFSTDWYQNLERSFEQSRAANKPWQVAMFLAVELRETEETLNVIKEQIQQQHLVRAAVLTFSKDSTPNLYILTKETIQKPITPIVLDKSLSNSELIYILFKQLYPRNIYYTAVIINGHSRDGAIMRYSDDKFFFLSEFLDQINKLHLYIDVFDLQVCMLGNLYTAYKLARSANVHYALLSSHKRRGSRKQMYYYLLTQFNHTPKEAALATSQKTAEGLDFSSDHQTHNLFVLDVSKLAQPLQAWSKEINILNTPIEKTSVYDVLRSFDTPTTKTLFSALQESTFAQWCYSAKDHETYYGQFPSDSDCLNGLYSDRYTLGLFLRSVNDPSF